jgi:LacI family transcriptional regulator
VGEVLFDNRAGVTLALQHLRQLGHRRVLVLCPPGVSTADRPAETWVRSEAGRLGLDVSVASSHPQLAAATATARQALEETPRCTAAFCFSDSLAYGVYAAAGELDIAIPDGLSVVGYDDHPVSALLSPPLTTFAWNTKSIVRRAVQMLLDAWARDDGEPLTGRRVLVDPVFSPRGSTAPPPTGRDR